MNFQSKPKIFKKGQAFDAPRVKMHKKVHTYTGPERRTGELMGIFRQVGEDFGFIDPIESADTVGKGANDGIFVHARKSLDALDGDTVMYRESPGRGGQTEARVVHVRKRSNKVHFGVYSELKGSRVVKLFDRGLQVRVIGANAPVKWEPQRVLESGITIGVTVTGYGNAFEARIASVIGREWEGRYYQELLLAGSGVPREFKSDVIVDAKAARARAFTAGERRDLRSHTIITIDGADAKDLDDAIEVERTPNGYRLGVHIADVSAYVPGESVLDIEAARRGTSIYLADSVIPMLPEMLSNDLCSLQPGSPKLCLSISLELSLAGLVQSAEVYESTIETTHRATYEEIEKDRAARGLAGAPVPTPETPPTTLPRAVQEMMNSAWDLKAALDKRRASEGKIEFIGREAKCILSPDGKLTELKVYPSYPSNDLIEAFMVIANEEVSRWASENSLVIPYRIHPVPTPIGLQRLTELLAGFNIPLILADPEKPTSKEISRAINALHSADPEGFASKGAISSMAKAFYSEKATGHFGLALSYYSHFTSPIRRYPDLLLHRAIKNYLAKGARQLRTPEPAPDHRAKENSPVQTTPNKIEALKLATPIYKKCSELEVRAEKLEYAYRDILICEWLAPRLGENFEGRVTSVMDKWVFVEFLPFVEGFLTGVLSESQARVGAKVPVTLKAVSIKTRRIDLVVTK